MHRFGPVWVAAPSWSSSTAVPPSSTPRHPPASRAGPPTCSEPGTTPRRALRLASSPAQLPPPTRTATNRSPESLQQHRVLPPILDYHYPIALSISHGRVRATTHLPGETARLLRAFHSSTRRYTTPIDGLSHTRGPTDRPLLDVTLPQFWSQLVKDYAQSPALVVRHERADIHSPSSAPGGVTADEDCIRWTFDEMDRNIDALARGLRNHGVQKGDRIGVFLGNNSCYALLQWATAKIGAVLVCINPSAPAPELLVTLNLSGVSTLFISPTIRRNSHLPMLRQLFPALASTPADQDLHDEVCPTLKQIVIVDNTKLGAVEFGKMLEEEGFTGRDARHWFDWSSAGTTLEVEGQSVEDVVNHQFTSGTTGNPKAVALTHNNILNNGLLIGDCMHLRPPDLKEGWQGERLINAPPFFHCFGLVLGNLAFWTHGGCIIVASESFDATQVLRAAYLEKATAIHGVPTMFIVELGLLEKLEKGEDVPGLSDLVPPGGGRLEFPSLRTGIAAGSPVPDEVMRKLVKRMNLKDLTITYGQTETSPASFMSTIHDPLELRCTTVGRILPHTHARIVDPNHPLYPSPETPSLPVNSPGELFSGGYLVMHSYHENPAETEKSVFYDKDGVKWLRTGDLASMDEEGYVKIRGRIKDIILRGGENLFPVVIEARTMLLEGIEDVYAIAVPDPIMGEVVGLFIERAKTKAGRNVTSQMVRDHVKKLLRIPIDWVWYLGEDGVGTEWPKTASGKIRKVELRDWATPLVERELGKLKSS
ncbi:BZ3500_MvSof-1268-A1-R1_Chr3-3g06546 [Microbotryum saponariae]|uniref:BZ3500_MvSof-1268-A1-R1_Chr3-3g06546 protein n=1 Tax=Microbotryum saponariae TaxID=289078 RepID=A0A2X0L159_9BASI|nr:BZ3500_MvSof-1268-A1-R1_Chr3-3g06546 [Microbotryum saponariae]SDA04513.1 BZ3501_MvSof-1269-A2-R1_Chr3-2g06233 [Microbotryum saponariae]